MFVEILPADKSKLACNTRKTSHRKSHRKSHRSTRHSKRRGRGPCGCA